MCSRVSATRDPGSVSEAESEEENEEGDYTVYECPGLASVSYVFIFHKSWSMQLKTASENLINQVDLKFKLILYLILYIIIIY